MTSFAGLVGGTRKKKNLLTPLESQHPQQPRWAYTEGMRMRGPGALPERLGELHLVPSPAATEPCASTPVDVLTEAGSGVFEALRQELKALNPQLYQEGFKTFTGVSPSSSFSSSREPSPNVISPSPRHSLSPRDQDTSNKLSPHSASSPSSSPSPSSPHLAFSSNPKSTPSARVRKSPSPSRMVMTGNMPVLEVKCGFDLGLKLGGMLSCQSHAAVSLSRVQSHPLASGASTHSYPEKQPEDVHNKSDVIADSFAAAVATCYSV